MFYSFMAVAGVLIVLGWLLAAQGSDGVAAACFLAALVFILFARVARRLESRTPGL